MVTIQYHKNFVYLITAQWDDLPELRLGLGNYIY